MLLVKTRQLSIVYNYRTVRHAITKKWLHFRKAGTLHFHFMDKYSKLAG